MGFLGISGWARLCAVGALSFALGCGAQERSVSSAQGAPSKGEARLALLVGNGNYKSSPLLNPVNDVRAMARVLADSGFKVVRKENAGQKEMLLALREFGDELRKNGGVGLFYYAGHGMQVKGKNYLIPIDAMIEREDEIAYASVDANQILDKMESAGNRLNIVILDACRNNPFARSFRSGATGLAQMDAPVGTLVAFSTAPGAVASDGSGANGLYTEHLLRAIREPGAKIEDVFKRVRANVRRDTEGKQIPWESTSLEGDFVFFARPPQALAAAPREAQSVAPVTISEIEAPRLSVGDRWEYQKIDMLSGSLIRNFNYTLRSVTASEWVFERSVFDKSWNLLRVVDNGKLERAWKPKRPNFDFPLRVGKTWQATGVLETERFKSENVYSFKVIRQERVLVPAGVFDTLRVEGGSKYTSTNKAGQVSEGTTVHRYWFSPDVRSYVAYEFEESDAKGKVTRRERDELLAYRRVQ